MNEEQLKEFEKRLTDWRFELAVGAGRTVDGMHEAGKQSFADPSDRASVETDYSATLRIRDRERKLVQKIDGALERIKDGTFGLCEECGEPISVERLKARLVTTLCIQCKAEQEEEEKRQRRV